MNMAVKNVPPPQFKLEKPDYSKIVKSEVLKKIENLEELAKYMRKINEPQYLYWDDARYKEIPTNLIPEEAWYLVRQFREILSQRTSIRTEKGDYFKWMKLSYIDEFLHKIDVSSGGQIFASMDVLSGSNKQKFISRGVLEEAIASSQLEGAHTTRQAAKEMIAEKRNPRNKDEQMILNNYNTILKIDEIYKKQALSEELLFELHRMLTRKTIDEKAQGRYRQNSDKIIVQGQIGTEEYVTHVPPTENFIKSEIKKLIDYANDTNEVTFLHPIIKAIFLHFWVGFLHPFVDGNGRLARSLFYWYLLRKNYWTFMYLPISLVIKRAPTQYAMAYIYSEQDSYDITYFFDFHIRKIIQALNDFNNYVERTILENKEIDKIISKNIHLTDRQKYLLHHLISEDGANTTVTSHAVLNNISRQTAAKDIRELEKNNLVIGKREGKYIKYQASKKLHGLLPQT